MISNQEANKRIKVTQGNFLSMTDVDAWGCFITRDMIWEGKLNSSILDVAGQEFDDYVLDNIFAPKGGQVFCLPAFAAPIDNILLGVIPEWRDGLFDEEQLIIRCYRNLMLSVEENNINSISLPALGAGQKRFPQRRIIRLTLSAILGNMPDCLESLQIICKDEDALCIYQELLS